jgi:hypothetical protein
MGALSKITHRAKQIRKKHPGTSWKGAIKKASAEYRSGRIGSISSHDRKIRRGKKRRATAKRKRAVARVKRLHRAEGHALSMIGTVSYHKKAIRDGIKRQIERKAGMRELAIKKNQRKKLTRQIAKLRKDYRAHC